MQVHKAEAERKSKECVRANFDSHRYLNYNTTHREPDRRSSGLSSGGRCKLGLLTTSSTTSRTALRMTSYLYELPTTGAISFADTCVDSTATYTADIADTTEARANLRAALKESKRTDNGEKDYLRLVKVRIAV